MRASHAKSALIAITASTVPLGRLAALIIAFSVLFGGCAKAEVPQISPAQAPSLIAKQPQAVVVPSPARVSLVARAALHPDFGRLVLETPLGTPAIGMSVSRDEKGIVVRFARPVTLSLAESQRRLGGYLSHLAMAADGLSLSASWSQTADLRQSSFHQGSIVLDFVPRRDALKPPVDLLTARSTPPIEKAKPGLVPLASRLMVKKAGATDRLMLDLPRSVDAQLREAGGKARIVLSRPLRLNLPRINAALPQPLRSFELTPDGTAIAFSLPPGRHVQLRRDGKHLIADVLPPVSAPPPPPMAAASSAPAAVQAPLQLPSTPLVQPTPAEPPPPAVPPGFNIAGAGASAADDKAAAAMPGGPVAQPLTGSLGQSEDLRLIWTLAGEELSFRFDWQQPTSAVIFRRANTLWIVFDKNADLDLSRFAAQNLPVVSTFETVPTKTGLALRLTIWPGFNPAVRRAGNAWIVDLNNKPMHPQAPINPVLKGAAGGLALDFAVLDPGSPISVADPATDELLVAVPLPQLGQGVSSTLEMPDLQTLASVQGLAFRPISDLLSIRTDQNLVEITAPNGLTASSESDRHLTNVTVGDTKFLFNFADWAGPPGKDLLPHRQQLQRSIAQAPDEQRLAARLDLVHFYVANAMGAEALGVMSAIDREAPQAFDDPTLRALRGAAEALMNQPAEASRDLDDASLDKASEVALWRAAEAAERQDLKTMTANYMLGKSYLAAYPPELRRRLSLALAGGLVDAGDQDSAQNLVNDVLASDPSRGQRDMANLLSGRIAASKGDAQKAIALWSEVAASPLPSLARAQASFALALAQLDAGKATRSETIKALDRLRFAWRGDSFEITLLRKLATLQIQDGDYRAGFESLRRILANFPPGDATRGITEEMQQDFTDIFIGKEAGNVPPVTALAVYDEFKELTPSGISGDAVNRGLTDRLVSIDLLDRAAQLLDDEARKRLSGVEQAKVAARLALIRLLDRKPQAALNALDIPRGAALPSDLARQSQEFRADAMFELGQGDAALKLLEGDTTADADRLRFDIYWRTHNWPAVSAILLRQLQSASPAGQVDDATAGKIMSLATAMALSDNKAGLATLQSTYGGAMQKTSLQTDFQALVDAGSLGSSGLGSMSGGQSSETFLDGYRQRIGASRLSAIN